MAIPIMKLPTTFFNCPTQYCRDLPLQKLCQNKFDTKKMYFVKYFEIDLTTFK